MKIIKIVNVFVSLMMIIFTIQVYADDTKRSVELEKATFGAGCFWGVEATFAELKGVVSTAVGYSGGSKENPTYQEVCSGTTGHAESVMIEYDPAQISYDKLLEVFWKSHNPTSYHRQGPDIGSQYRSVIFYYTEAQKKIAEESRDKLQKSGKFDKDIVTEIIPAMPFYMAEEYHQKYYKKHGISCH